MARTSGHGNPDWTRDETLLALELYLENKGQIPGPGDPRVVALSSLLRTLPIHAMGDRTETFRNPEGVAFKLQNLRAVETGKGLTNTAATDREIWDGFGGKPDEVRRLAALIKAGAETVVHLPDADDETGEFREGRVLTKIHRQRERDRSLRKHVLANRRKKGALVCECCGTRGLTGDANAEAAIFEVHHLVPLAHLDQRTTRLSDVCLLCANCHRAIHRTIIEARRWVLPSESAERVGNGWVRGHK